MTEPVDNVIDTDIPAIARVYDYLLGGKHNYPADRAASQAMIDAVPETPLLAQANRSFIRRAVEYLVAEAGIRQIVDIGSGLPTAGNVHEIAQGLDSSVRVAYVDYDPIVLAHGRALLVSNPNTTVITADLRDPDTIFKEPEIQRLIDQSQSFAVILGGVMMHVEDNEDPVGVAAKIKNHLPSGGYLVYSDCSDPDEPRAKELNRIFEEQHMGSSCFRQREQQLRFLEGLELVEPGLVPCSQWRPNPDMPGPDNPAHPMVVGSVGRKP